MYMNKTLKALLVKFQKKTLRKYNKTKRRNLVKNKSNRRKKMKGG